jgi:L-threonylcarbamoyladenylate synthase
MPDPLDPAVRALRGGGLAVVPTDTLYGLSARADDEAAVQRLASVKRRPAGLPISVMVSSTEEIEGIADLSEMARGFVRRTLPGPVTLIVPTRPGAPIAPALLHPNGTLGIRVPDHPVARELARRAGPITATSANRHGETPGRTLVEIRRALGRDVAAYVNLGPLPSGRPSELIDLTGDQPRRLQRPVPPRGR